MLTYIDKTLTETDLSNLQGLAGRKFEIKEKLKSGKVRDIYRATLDGEQVLVLVTTDRHSSFDRIIAHIPHKGQCLNLLSKFWFEKTKDIVPNHVIDVPHPNVLIAKEVKPLPVEIVVRGYITGVTNTSLWTNYKNGQRDFGSFVLEDGLKKNQKLPKPVLTPTTKSDLGDRNISADEIVKEGLVNEKIWRQIEDVAIRLFKRGQDIAAKSGLILVDTKYEFGLDDDGSLILIDEIHTPDSSRYWQANSYEERFSRGEDPEAFDKEFLRVWFKENCDPYKDEVLPEAPGDLVKELSRRYIQIYEQIAML